MHPIKATKAGRKTGESKFGLWGEPERAFHGRYNIEPGRYNISFFIGKCSIKCLTMLYEVPTKALKQAAKRNLDRFPDDFMFELSQDEYAALRSQNVTLDNLIF